MKEELQAHALGFAMNAVGMQLSGLWSKHVWTVLRSEIKNDWFVLTLWSATAQGNIVVSIKAGAKRPKIVIVTTEERIAKYGLIQHLTDLIRAHAPAMPIPKEIISTAKAVVRRLRQATKHVFCGDPVILPSGDVQIYNAFPSTSTSIHIILKVGDREVTAMSTVPDGVEVSQEDRAVLIKALGSLWNPPEANKTVLSTDAVKCTKSTKANLITNLENILDAVKNDIPLWRDNDRMSYAGLWFAIRGIVPSTTAPFTFDELLAFFAEPKNRIIRQINGTAIVSAKITAVHETLGVQYVINLESENEFETRNNGFWLSAKELAVSWIDVNGNPIGKININ